VPTGAVEGKNQDFSHLKHSDLYLIQEYAPPGGKNLQLAHLGSLWGQEHFGKNTFSSRQRTWSLFIFLHSKFMHLVIWASLFLMFCHLNDPLARIKCICWMLCLILSLIFSIWSIYSLYTGINQISLRSYSRKLYGPWNPEMWNPF